MIAREGQDPAGIGGGPELRGTVEGVAQRDAVRDAVEPVSGREVHDGHRGLAQQVDRRRTDPDPAAEHELAHVAQPHAGELLTRLLDHDHLAALADSSALFLDVQRQGFVVRGIQPADRGLGRRGRVGRHVAEGERFVRQADAVEGAAVALGAVVERIRQYSGERRGPRLLDVAQRACLELGRERHVHAGLRALVIEDAMVAAVAVLPEQEPLGHELHALRLPAPLGVVGDASALGVHGHRLVSRGGDEIQLGDDPQTRRAESDRARDGRPLVAIVLGACGIVRTVRTIARIGNRQHVIEPVHAAVCVLAFHRVDVVLPPAFDVHEVEEPRAVDELVEHADREEVGGVAIHGVTV